MNFDSDSDADEAMDPVLDTTITIVPVGPWKAGTPVDDEDELDEEHAQELVDATVTLSAPVDLSGNALTVLRERLPIPRAFARSGWLRGHHLLELDEQGRAVVEDLSIHHHPTFGLLIEQTP